MGVGSTRTQIKRCSQKEQRFIDVVWEHYTQRGRHSLPWRKTQNPYRILVSEVMLQQTQVDRVLPKYKAFLKEFPTVHALAKAPLSAVLIAWQGLGYNRRAKMLHRCAQEVVRSHKGVFPREFVALLALPGVGPYTAAAVSAFAYNEPVPLIETNVRTVYIHHFFTGKDEVTDGEILALVVKTMSQEKPREWYWALMDYGSHLKKTVGNVNARSKHYIKQSTFKGSDRQIRGAILRILAQEGKLSRSKLHAKLQQFEDIRIDAQIEKLLVEELVVQEARSIRLAD